MHSYPHLMRHSVAACVLALSSFCAYADNSFTPQSGTWVVSAEVDGKPGRGMAIDVQDGTLVMQVYNYIAAGPATFHLATGSVVNNHVVAPLKSYKGGRFFGSAPLSGVEAGDAGNVDISFTSGTTGMVQFPGEAPVAMQRYRFEGLPADQLASKTWIVALQDAAGNVSVVDTVFSGTDDSGPVIGFVRVGASLPCQYILASLSFRCQGTTTQTPSQPIVVEFREDIKQLTGTVQLGGQPYRLTGLRAVERGYDVDIGEPFYLPQSGTWVVSAEVDGRPGRGMAIDVQNGTLVMQVYNYNAAGSATFHLTTAAYASNQASGALKSYAGGRYFGSGPRSGTEASDAGTVYLAFNSPTQGVVRFPGEGPLNMVRYQFGAIAPDPTSLLGTWALYDSTNKKTVTLQLTTVDGDAAKGSGVTCRYTTAATNGVRCTESFTITGRGTVYTTDYRFTAQSNIAYGKALLANTSVPVGTVPSDSAINSGTLLGLRITDRHGVGTGMGPLR